VLSDVTNHKDHSATAALLKELGVGGAADLAECVEAQLLAELRQLGTSLTTLKGNRFMRLLQLNVPPPGPTPTPTPPPSPYTYDRVHVSALSGGQRSSGRSVVVDGTFFDAVAPTTPVSVKVKLVSRACEAVALREFQALHCLWEASHTHFVRPYGGGLLRGEGVVVAEGSGDDCSDKLALVMERGVGTLRAFLDAHKATHACNTPALLAIAMELLEVLAAAHLAGWVLMDFKPQNMVRVCVRDTYLLRAIDFDNARKVTPPPPNRYTLTSY